MNCRKTRKEMPSYLAPHESGLKPKDREALEAHLAICDACRRDCEESRRAIEFFQKHWRISADTQALIDKANLREQEQKAVRVFSHSRTTIVRAAAAVIVICVGIAIALVASQSQQKSSLLARADTLNQPDSGEIVITENGVAVSSSDPLTTDGTNIREFLINGRYRLVMNRESTLSIDPLVKNGKLGCLIRLRSGQIFVNVDHDGNPFEVASPHGKLVITGTTFDVAVTDHETSLVVAEGSVRFESGKGLVLVKGGHSSTMNWQAAPSDPIPCEAESLMAWAIDSGAPPATGESSPELTVLLDELAVPTPYPSGPIDLDSLDYDQWVESKREWFKVQFPWIFKLQAALNTDSQLLTVEIDYPELLLQTRDIWQIVYPHRFYNQIPIIRKNNLLKVARTYELEGNWFDRKLSEAARSTERQTTQVFFGKEALNQWVSLAREVETDCDTPTKLHKLRDYSLVNSEYLENLRVLLWLCIHNNKYAVTTGHETEILQLLRHQVESAYTCKELAWYLSTSNRSEHSERNEYLRRLTDVIAELIDCERQLALFRQP